MDIANQQMATRLSNILDSKPNSRGTLRMLRSAEMIDPLQENSVDLLLMNAGANRRHNMTIKEPWRSTKDKLVSKYGSREQTSAIHKKLSLF